MKELFVCSLIILCFVAGTVAAEDVSAFLRRLDSDRLAERDAAEAALVRRGPDIEDLLPAEETLDGRPEFSEEVIYRLKNVFQELRLRMIREALEKIEFRLSKVESGGDDRSWVTLRTDWPKGVFPIRLAFPMNAIHGIDTENQTLPPVIQNGVLEIPCGKTQVSGELIFALHGRAPQSVKGNCVVLLAVAEKTFEFRRFFAESPAAKLERTIRKGETTVSVESVRFDANRLTVGFRVHFDQALAALESHRTWIYDNEVLLRLRSGGKIKPEAVKPVAQGGNTIVLAATFELPKEDEIVAFHYTTPTIIVEETVVFEALDR